MLKYILWTLAVLPLLHVQPDTASDAEVTCICEQENDIHCFFAIITMNTEADGLQYRLSVSTQGRSGRSTQRQSGEVVGVGDNPVHVGNIRVKVSEDASYECICVLESHGRIIAADTLRKQ